MLDTEELREAMRAGTAGLPMHMPIDRIHRRARSLRTTRAVGLAVAAAGVALALAVPGAALLKGGGRADRYQPAAPATSDPCATPTLGQEEEGDWYIPLGDVVETGSSVQGPAGKRWDVLLALTKHPNDPMFITAFRSRDGGGAEAWDNMGVDDGLDGHFSAQGEEWQFTSMQLTLAGGRLLDVGIYSGRADRITVGSEGRTSRAHVSYNAPTGITIFWIERTARPLPYDYEGVPWRDYQGPERLTVTAYDARGNVLHSVTGGPHLGSGVNNPRDNSPDPKAKPTPGIPCS